MDGLSPAPLYIKGHAVCGVRQPVTGYRPPPRSQGTPDPPFTGCASRLGGYPSTRGLGAKEIRLQGTPARLRGTASPLVRRVRQTPRSQGAPAARGGTPARGTRREGNSFAGTPAPPPFAGYASRLGGYPSPRGLGAREFVCRVRQPPSSCRVRQSPRLQGTPDHSFTG